jgi:tetratricopeptide (TPR) repeat protein
MFPFGAIRKFSLSPFLLLKFICDESTYHLLHTNTMNAASQQAIADNNAAVSQIEAGDYLAAIENLSSAVSSFKRLFSQSEKPLETNCDDITIYNCIANTFPLTGTNSTETEFLYEHPIRICENKVFGTTCCESSIIASMVIFNLALAHHLQANSVEQQEGSCYCHLDETTYANLQKARQLYEISLTMQRDAQSTTDPDKHNNDVFFMLAAFNNLGLVYRRLQNQDASVKCFQHILSTLMCLTDAGYADGLSSKWDGFFVNVTPLISKIPVARAA